MSVKAGQSVVANWRIEQEEEESCNQCRDGQAGHPGASNSNPWPRKINIIDCIVQQIWLNIVLKRCKAKQYDNIEDDRLINEN